MSKHLSPLLVATPLSPISTTSTISTISGISMLPSASFQADANDMSQQCHLDVSSSSSSFVSSVLTANAPPVTYPLPTLESLRVSLYNLHSMPDRNRLEWAQDVVRVLERYLSPGGQPTESYTDTPLPSRNIPRGVYNLLERAVPIIILYTTHSTPQLAALAGYLKAKLLASGAAPDFLPRDPRLAFKGYEEAARAGEVRGWVRLGRDYEGVGDLERAKDCFERGVERGDCECSYVSEKSSRLEGG